MRRVTLFAILMVSMLLARNTISGTFGYITNPSADGLLYQEFNIGAAAFSNTPYIPGQGAYYGSLGTSKGLELGFSGKTGREGVFLNLKFFRFLDDSDAPLMVGMGFENIASIGNNGDFPAAYMVTTKKFINGSSFSFGAKGSYIAKTMQMSAVCGTEIFLSDNLSTLFDITPVNDNQYNINGGLRLYNSRSTVFYIYILNMVRTTVDTSELTDAERYLEYPAIITLGFSYTGFMD